MVMSLDLRTSAGSAAVPWPMLSTTITGELSARGQAAGQVTAGIFRPGTASRGERDRIDWEILTDTRQTPSRGFPFVGLAQRGARRRARGTTRHCR